MTRQIFICALCFGIPTVLALRLQGKDTKVKAIPTTIWVTGEWAAGSKEVTEIHNNLEGTALKDKTMSEMTMQTRVEQKFAKWIPAGSTIKYFDDKDMEESAKKVSHMLKKAGVTSSAFEAYSNLRPGAFRADLWRYMILWANGGVYMDANMVLKEKIDKWVDFDKDDLVLVKDTGDIRGSVSNCAYWNAMMAASPKNKYLETVIKTVVSNIEKHYYGQNPLDITGPTALCKALGETGDYKEHARIELEWKDTRPVLENGKRGVDFAVLNGEGKSLASKDGNLHHPYDKKTHYDPMWRAHQVYCDQQGPEGSAGKCKQ